MSEIYLAGGCFWGMEKYIASIRGVAATQVGYANGNTEHPTYEDVCHKGTGHAETVRVTYHADVLPLPFLLDLYYAAIDPVSVNRQGGDSGTQYRTGIYYVDPADLPVIEASIAGLQARLNRPAAIEVKPLVNFHPAEEYHQRYLAKNPGGYCHIGADRFACAAAAIVNPADYTLPDPETLRHTLTPEQFDVTQRSATEAPFHNEFHDHYRPGIYVDITTGEPMFSSSDKFESAAAGQASQSPSTPMCSGKSRTPPYPGFARRYAAV